MSQYLSRKVDGRCTYPGCTAEPLDNHNCCHRHRDDHRERNRRSTRQRRSFRRAQLPLLHVGRLSTH